jgi:uncharacterized protein YjiS (DUF1127 family)
MTATLSAAASAPAPAAAGVRTAGRLAAGVVGAARAGAAFVLRAVREARARDRIEALDDRMLRDMGISRYDAAFLVRHGRGAEIERL